MAALRTDPRKFSSTKLALFSVLLCRLDELLTTTSYLSCTTRGDGERLQDFPIVLLFEKKLKVEEDTCCEGKVGEKKSKVKRRNSTRGYFKSEIRNTEQGDVIRRADLGGTATYNPKLCTKYKT